MTYYTTATDTVTYTTTYTGGGDPMPHGNSGYADTVDKTAYAQCQETGHVANGEVHGTKPAWDVCRNCGMWFHWEYKLVEKQPK